MLTWRPIGGCPTISQEVFHSLGRLLWQRLDLDAMPHRALLRPVIAIQPLFSSLEARLQRSHGPHQATVKGSDYEPGQAGRRSICAWPLARAL